MSKIIIGGHEVTVHKDYSTSEQFTGQYWIDGKKIYRKVIPFTSTQGVSSVSVSGCNIDVLVSSRVFIKNTNGGDYCVGSYYDTSNDSFNYYLNRGKAYFVLRSGTTYAYGTGYMTIEYTKNE